MEDRTAHFDAVKSTALFWIMMVAVVAVGALIRFSTSGSVEKVESPVTKASVLIQRSVERVVRQSNDERDNAAASDNTQPPPAVQQAQAEQTEKPPQRQDSSSHRPERAVGTIAPEPASPTRATSAEGSGSDELQPMTENLTRKSDFRHRLGYYTEVGQSLPDVHRRWARVDIQIDEPYWQASAAFGMRFVLMAGDFDQQNPAYGFNVASGTTERVSPDILSSQSWVVRELVGDIERMRTARQTVAMQLKLAHADEVRVFSLIPENIWTAEMGKIEDVLVRTHSVHLADVTRVRVGYENRGSDFDFVVKSMINRDGREAAVTF